MQYYMDLYCSFACILSSNFPPISASYHCFNADMNVSPVLFEQPVHRDDWNGLADVSGIARDQFGVTVVADESCQTLKDIEKIVQENITDGINIKLAKFGVLGVLQIVEVGRRSGLNLVIDSMVETRLGTGFAGHLAAGLGCFK